MMTLWFNVVQNLSSVLWDTFILIRVLYMNGLYTRRLRAKWSVILFKENEQKCDIKSSWYIQNMIIFYWKKIVWYIKWYIYYLRHFGQIEMLIFVDDFVVIICDLKVNIDHRCYMMILALTLIFNSDRISQKYVIKLSHLDSSYCKSSVYKIHIWHFRSLNIKNYIYSFIIFE